MYAHPTLQRLAVKLGAAAAAAGVTFALFAGVVSLADDHPMAIAGQPSPYVLAQKRAAEDARAAGVKITPMCGYVASVMKRHPEWDDVLKR